MIERQYCASCYVIDFKEKTILLMYNKKLNKWLQPGGHIEGMELPTETAIREVFEETGVKIKIGGPFFLEGHYMPVAVEHYVNKVGDMIDIQYLGEPLTLSNDNMEDNLIKWVKIDEIDLENDISEEIKVKAKTLYQKYKK